MQANRAFTLLLFSCSALLPTVPQASSREELDAFGLAYDAPNSAEKIKACERFLARYPESAFVEKIWQLEFEAFSERGDSAAAMRVGREIVRLDPHQSEVLSRMAVLAAASSDVEEQEHAAAYAKSALAGLTAMHRPDEMPVARYVPWKKETAARAHAVLGEIALRAGEAGDAVRELKTVVVLVPNKAEYWKILGLAHLQLKQFPEAAAAIEHAASISPDLPELHFLLGAALFQERNFAASQANLLLAVTENPAPREAFLYLLRDYVALDQLDLNIAERAASLFPQDAELQFEIGQAALDHIRSLARKANALGPESREFQEFEARKHGAQAGAAPSELASEYDATAALVRRCYQVVLNVAPDSSYANRVLGYLAESQNQIEDALSDYRAGADHFAAGRLLAQNARYAEAAIEFRAELAARPDNHLALAQLSQLYVQLEQFDLAEPILSQLLSLYPSDAYAWLDKGRIQQRRGHWQEAAESFQKALAIDSTLSQARYRLATVYQRLGKRASASDELQRFQAEQEKRP